MIDEEWKAICDTIADKMKVFTRPCVTILASPSGGPTEIGTGTFIEKDGVKLLTCEHVARFNPSAHFVDESGTTEVQPGIWCVEPDPSIDAAVARMSPEKWSRISGSARPLPMSKFAAKHTEVQHEIFFFRGIAGENAHFSAFGDDAILTGYCSQEKKHAGDTNKFEILWSPRNATVTSGTDSDVRARFKYENPAGFSGSLVWNTRFVELGCDLSNWSPCDAAITGLLRRYDADTATLLAWRVEHLLRWL